LTPHRRDDTTKGCFSLRHRSLWYRRHGRARTQSTNHKNHSSDSDDRTFTESTDFVNYENSVNSVKKEILSKKKCRFLTPGEKFKFLEKNFKTALGQFELETCTKAFSDPTYYDGLFNWTEVVSIEASELDSVWNKYGIK
jgi:hypothetical protein